MEEKGKEKEQPQEDTSVADFCREKLNGLFNHFKEVFKPFVLDCPAFGKTLEDREKFWNMNEDMTRNILTVFHEATNPVGASDEIILSTLRKTLVPFGTKLVDIEDSQAMQQRVLQLRSAMTIMVKVAFSATFRDITLKADDPSINPDMREIAKQLKEGIEAGAAETLFFALEETMKNLPDAFFIKLQRYFNAFNEVVWE